MKIKATQWSAHLAKPSLAPMYLISGDDILLVEEARAQLVKRAKELSFNEHHKIFIEPQYKWENLPQQLMNMPLLATRKIVDVRLAHYKPGTSGGKIITEYAERADKDTLLIITCNKLDGGTQRSKWVKALEKHGIFFQLWPINRQQFPNWVRTRAQHYQLTLAAPAVELLCEHTEGNLLACDQALQTLQLLSPNDSINPQQVAACLGNDAKYDLFDMVDVALAADSKRLLTMLNHLQATQVEPILILWALTRQIRQLIDMQLQLKTEPANTIWQRHRIWGPRQNLIQACLKRLPVVKCQPLLSKASDIDAMIKGVKRGQVWPALTELCLQLAGKPLWTAKHD